MTDDDLDTRILTALVRDGRATVRELADTTGAPATTVQERVRSLEHRGVIQGYRPDVDYEALGYGLTVVFRVVADGDEFPGLTDRLRENSHLLEVYEVTGRFDVIAIGKYLDAEAMNDGVRRLLSDPAVREADSALVQDIIAEQQSFSVTTGGCAREQNP